MERGKRKITGWLSIIFLIALVIFLWEILFEYVIQPIILILWLFWRLTLSVNQNIYWFLFLIGIAVLALRLNSRWRNEPENKVQPYAYRPPLRSEYWQKLYSEATARRRGRELLRNRLRDLALNILIQGEKGGQDDVQVRLRERIATLPAPMRAYLFPPTDEYSHEDQAQNHSRFSFIRNRQAEKEQIQATLQWMENELEITYENIKN